MPVSLFTAAVLAVSVIAGLFGSLTGLGGGVVLTPVLTLFFGVDIRYAIGASLVSVIATSSGCAAAYVRDGYSNIRIGMFLEIATTFGALLGAFVATRVPTSNLGIIFGVVLLQSAWQAGRERKEVAFNVPPEGLAERLRLAGSYATPAGEVHYKVSSPKTGFAVMLGSGALSGLLGIGSGALKVLALDRVMKVPFKVSTATSNFMIGVTGAASAGVYLHRGYIDPGLAMPVMLGVLCGSTLGARLLKKLEVKILRIIFAIVVGVMAVQMIAHGLAGRF